MSRANARPIWKALLGALAMGTVGALVGMGVARVGLLSDGVRSGLDALGPWDLLALPILFLLVIAVHEAGHLLAGLARGMRFLLYVVGPFGWVRGADGVRFRWFFNLGTLGGMAATLPDSQRPLDAQMMPVVLGGPIASVLLAVFALAVFAATDGRAAGYALIVGLLSCLIFVVTALPFRAGGFMSDGMQWLAYRRGGAEVARRARVSALMGQSMAGTRPRELDAALLAQAQSDAGDDVLCSMGVWMYSYAHALDNGRLEEAEAWAKRMAEAVDRYPDGFRQGVMVELAIFQALHRRALEPARQWLRGARGGIVDRSRRSLAEAAVGALEGNTEAARRALEAAQHRHTQALDAGYARMGLDQMHGLRSMLQAEASPQLQHD